MKRIYIAILTVIFLSACSFITEYPSSKAQKYGDIILGPPGPKNIEKIDEFVLTHSEGKEVFLRIADYTDEGDAILRDLRTDGEKIKYSIDTRRDEFGTNEIKKFICQDIVVEQLDDKREYYLDGCSGEMPKQAILVVYD